MSESLGFATLPEAMLNADSAEESMTVLLNHLDFCQPAFDWLSNLYEWGGKHPGANGGVRSV